MKYVDLFCGMGSFHSSFQKLNWTCVMACDIDKSVQETYNFNYGMLPMGDITDINPKEIPNYDILCAGFPCQPFSQCGQHKGFQDERGTLFFNVMKFIEFHKPKIIILENVPGLVNHNSGDTFKLMKSEIINQHYEITYKVLKCSDYGLPQMRKRLFVVGVKQDCELVKHIDKLLDFEEYKHKITLSEFFNKQFEKEIAYTIRCGGRHSPIHDKHNWDGYIVNGEQYRLTKEDCLRLQGFDVDFRLYGNNQNQWKQLGNTIPIVFTDMIGRVLKKHLSKT